LSKQPLAPLKKRNNKIEKENAEAEVDLDKLSDFGDVDVPKTKS